MPSEGQSWNTEGGSTQGKRRRLHGACDLCRQKKTRCDSAKRPGNLCTNCATLGAECTHLYMNQKVGQGYLASRKGLSSPSESLSLPELRESMDTLLTKILTPTYQAPTNPNIIRETIINLARYARALESALPPDALSREPPTVPPFPSRVSSSRMTLSSGMSSSSQAPSSNPPSPSSPTNSLDPNASEYEELNALAENLKRSVVLTSTQDMFLGSPSSMSLLDTAITLGGGSAPPTGAIPSLRVAKHMRPEFWSVHPWDKAPPPRDIPLIFPEPDLLQDLIDLYFDKVDVYTPLLHRPSFERDIKAELHLSNPMFGGTVLAMCAVASRYSNDPRVLLEGTDSIYSAGHKWFRQLDIFNESNLHAASLHEMQTVCLSIDYLGGTSTPEIAWFMAGLGARAAVDVGMNRKRCGKGPPTVEDELRKRVFWRIVFDDAMMSLTVGRPPAINPADFDLELPVDCDDEYWENDDPSLAFKQPDGKPTRASYFISIIKLTQIYLSARQAFYSVKHPDVPEGMTDDEWDQAELARLNAALNAWVDSVPDHLRWGKPHLDPVFLDQCAILHTTYYFIQILIHRPFLSYPKKPSMSFTALAVCTNAARACSKIMEVQSKTGYIPLPQVHLALFVSGLMLLLSIWKGRRTGFAMMDERKEAIGVQATIRVLQTYEDRWPSAGRLRDLLVALTAVGGFEQALATDGDNDTSQPNPQLPGIIPLKRRREACEDDQTSRTGRQPTSLRYDSSNGGTPPPAKRRSPSYELPIYSSDLSTPFFPFHPCEASGSQARNSPFTSQQMEKMGSMMLEQEDTTSHGGGMHGFQMAPISSFGSGMQSTRTNYDRRALFDQKWGSGSNQASPYYLPEDPQLQMAQTPSSQPTMNLQEVWAHWSNTSAGPHEWNDWNKYMAALESSGNTQSFEPSTNGLASGLYMDDSQYAWHNRTLPLPERHLPSRRSSRD